MPPSRAAWLPSTTPVSAAERLRSAVGALLGILVTGLVSQWAVGTGGALPVLIAPMGASAVLLFAVPSSPLAQPWSVMGGNVLAATVGVSVALVVANPLIAAAAAVGASVALMMTFRCTHPPSGAIALTAVLGGHAIRDLGYGFVLWPVGANSLLLLGAALAFNNATGRSYPHRAIATVPGHNTADPPSAARVGFAKEDLDAVLAGHDQLLEIGRDDLEAILREAEVRSYRRRSGQATCATIMSRDVVAIAPDAPIADALTLLRNHRIKVLPVTDESARVLGIVTQTDLLDKAAWTRRGPQLSVRDHLRFRLTHGRAPHGVVGDIMTDRVTTATAEVPLADLVRVMARTGLHHIPIVDGNARLRGIVSQSDLIVALLAKGGDAPGVPRTG